MNIRIFSFRLTQAALIAVLVTGMQFMPIAPFMAPAIAASKLGDLAKFKKIVVDTEALVEKGKLEEAKAKIKELEVSWDEAEPSLKPRSAADWHLVDKAIDHALEALRANGADAASCKKTLAEVHTLMDRMS
jgi:hypothetical protein